MKVSVNWIREYMNLNLPQTEALVAKIGAQLGGVDGVIDLGSTYRGIVIARVANVRKMEDSDHLNVCLINDGRVTQNINREYSGLVQVVCGAPNVREGMLVAWLPPGSVVPSSYDDAEPFVLSARPLRGVVSNGMLASAKELGIGDSHEGLLELDGDHQPGDDFATAYGLNDTIIDIENKMFTHRPDCFGQLGVAREIAGILGRPFTSPSWYTHTNSLVTTSSEAISQVSVVNEIPELVPRYMVVAVDDVTIAPSPVWLQTYLSRLGVRPINNIVDVTNYIMLLTGQPLHAFDFDKVAVDGQAQIVIRNPHVDEKLTLLDGKTIAPRPDAILIADQEKAIALGGVMGGSNSEIDANTKRILVECANFDMYNIRRTSMEHGIFSDAVTRFTKGQSEWQCPPVLAKAVQMIQSLCEDAKPIGRVVDNHVPRRDNQPVPVGIKFINERLGLKLSGEAMRDLLVNVEFDVTEADNGLVVAAPFWRTDIELREDVVEEVGRLYGFDQLPLVLPQREITPTIRDAGLQLKSQLRTTLSRAGANELLTYSFVHGNLLDKVGQDRSLAYKLSNALSPDLQYYRLTLQPSLLDKVHSNIKAGYDAFAIFEIGKTHNLPHADDPEYPVNPVDDVLPEGNSIALVFAADTKAAKRYSGAAFYQAKAYLMTLLQSLGMADKVSFEMYAPETYVGSTRQKTTQYEVGRTATIRIDNYCVGEIGEYSATVRKSLKLPDYSAGFELNLLVLQHFQTKQHQYQPLPRFPKVTQDITLRVATDITYQQVHDVVTQTLDSHQLTDTKLTVSPVSIYQSPDDPEHKNITLRLQIASYVKTLTDVEVAGLLSAASTAAQEQLNAERI